MLKKWAIKWLLSGILVILIMSLSSWVFSLSNSNEEALLASAAENNNEKILIPVEEKSNEEKILIPVEENNNEEVILAPIEENNNEEISSKEITSQEAIEVIRKAYLSSLYIFNRDVDPSQSIEEGIYCRPLDKELSNDDILATLKGYYTERFIENGKIATKALKIHEGKLYVLLLQGQYDYNSNFEVVSLSSTEDTAEVRVKLITEYDTLESEVTLKQEEGTWKVEDGVIFPQIP